MHNIDTKALAMTDDERIEHLEERGWQNMGIGWFPPGGDRKSLTGGFILRTSSGGCFSLSSAIREQLARETPGTTPDALGRHYCGSEPANATGNRW
jgi:hypothetical protein